MDAATISERTAPYLWGVWAGVTAQIGGRLIDARWHATHAKFEGASEQLRAHWLLWIGILVVLVVAGLAFTKLSARERGRGLAVVLIGAGLYVPVAVWHFVEHALGSDPEVAHVLLAIGQATIIFGAIWALVEWSRSRPGGRSGTQTFPERQRS